MGNTLNVINGAPEWTGPARPASQVASELQKSMLMFKSECMAADGSGVDYEKIATFPSFLEYTDRSRELQKVDLDALTEDEKKAFFINVYNVLTIHGLALGTKIPGSVLHIKSFWKITAYNIGGHVFSLDDIEHGVLRANKPHPYSLFPNFGADDPRVKFTFAQCDPRIHFALVCGAKSCPAIQVYSATNLERGLNGAATSFCNQDIEVNAKGEIALSKIFQWYGKDFGASTTDILRYCMPFLEEAKAKQIDDILSKSPSPKVVYKEYNWDLNSSKM